MKRQAGRNNIMHSKMKNLKNPYVIEENTKKWKAAQITKEGKRLLLQLANRRVDLCLRTCKKCARPDPDYKKGHEPMCPKAKTYKPPPKELMSVLESKDLQQVPIYIIADFVRRGLLEKSVLQQCKQFYIAQRGQEKQPAIQQFVSEKKPPPVITMPPQVQPPAVILPQEVPFHKPRRIADVADFKWKDMTANLLKRAIPAEMATWSEEKRESIVNHCQRPAYLVALLEYIHSQLPSMHCNVTKLGGGER
jgi:hypothetical protein